MPDLKNRLIQIVCDMINIDTCQPSGNESKMVQYILNATQGWSMKPEVKVIDHEENRSSLLLTFPASDGCMDGGYALAGHTDTVEIGDSGAWSSHPHRARITENRIIGRGAADMKSGVASMMLLAEFFANTLLSERHEAVHFCFTADEERGGIGILSLMDEPRFQGLKGLLIPEPTDSRVATAEKGTLQIRVRARGKQAHASQPGKGINAIDLLIRLSDSLKSLIQSQTADPFYGLCTLTLSAMRGGAGVNIVPPAAEMDLDIRTVPGIRHDGVLKFLREEMDRLQELFPGSALEREILSDRPAVGSDPEDSFIQGLFRVMEGKKEPLCMPYYTDASQFVQKVPCPFVIYGPGSASQAHQANEFVDVDDLWRHYLSLQTYFTFLTCK